MQDLNEQEEAPENDVHMEDVHQPIPPQHQFESFDTLPVYPPPQRVYSRERINTPPPSRSPAPPTPVVVEDTSQDEELARRLQQQELAPPSQRTYDTLDEVDSYFTRPRTTSDPTRVIIYCYCLF